MSWVDQRKRTRNAFLFSTFFSSFNACWIISVRVLYLRSGKDCFFLSEIAELVKEKNIPFVTQSMFFFSVIHQLCFFSVIHQHISMFFVQSPYYWINPDTGQLSIHKVNPSPTFCRWGRLLGRRSCRLATVREFAVAKTSLVGWAMGL